MGTHGKLKNWVQKRLLDLDGVAILVFDEADEMLKADGFADDSVGGWGGGEEGREGGKVCVGGDGEGTKGAYVCVRLAVWEGRGSSHLEAGWGVGCKGRLGKLCGR